MSENIQGDLQIDWYYCRHSLEDKLQHQIFPQHPVTQYFFEALVHAGLKDRVRGLFDGYPAPPIDCVMEVSATDLGGRHNTQLGVISLGHEQDYLYWFEVESDKWEGMRARYALEGFATITCVRCGWVYTFKIHSISAPAIEEPDSPRLPSGKQRGGKKLPESNNTSSSNSQRPRARG